MVIFAWILFVLSILSVLLFTYYWFAEGSCFLELLQSIALVVYLVFYLFLTPFNTIVSWVYFGCYCLLFLISFVRRALAGTIVSVVYVIFFALIVF